MASTKAQQQKSMVSLIGTILLVLTIVAAVFVGNTMANKGNKGEDIILYNGNIIMRGKKKEGNIVLANSGGATDIEFMPPFWGMGGMGGMGRKRRSTSE